MISSKGAGQGGSAGSDSSSSGDTTDSSASEGFGACLVFDTSNPGCNANLGSPNESCGGPGEGSGGSSGLYYENCPTTAVGNVLVIEEIMNHCSSESSSGSSDSNDASGSNDVSGSNSPSGSNDSSSSNNASGSRRALGYKYSRCFLTSETWRGDGMSQSQVRLSTITVVWSDCVSTYSSFET